MMNRFYRLLLRVAFIIGICFVLIPNATKAEALTPSQESAVDAKVKQIVATIPSWADTDAEKVLYLHDYVVNNVVYEMVGEHQNAYGALISGKAVCAGYADAYLRLLTEVGIQARTMTGTGNGEPHAWTQLYLDGKCYYTDTTWDAPFITGTSEQILTHNYFNLSYKKMASDHIFDAESLKYVDKNCTHSGLDYYDIMSAEGSGVGIFSDSTTAKTAAKYFKLTKQNGNTAVYVCEFRFDGSDYDSWFETNVWNIAYAIGLESKPSQQLSVKYSENPTTSTYKIEYTGWLDSPSVVSVTSVDLRPASATLTKKGETLSLSYSILPSNATNQAVSFKSSNKSVATVSNSGVVTAVGEGTATITVTTADGSKTDTCVITVKIAHVHDSKLKAVAATAASCGKEGNQAYYICESCGAWFSDSNASKEIKDQESVKIPALEHTPSGLKYDKNKHWKVCTRSGCGKTIDGTSGNHQDTDGNSKCDICGYALTGKVPETPKPTDPTPTDPTNPADQTVPGTSVIPEPTTTQKENGEKDTVDVLIDNDMLMLIGGIGIGVIVLCIVLIAVSKRKR